jgi:hypothetical protein
LLADAVEDGACKVKDDAYGDVALRQLLVVSTVTTGEKSRTMSTVEKRESRACSSATRDSERCPRGSTNFTEVERPGTHQ